MKKEEFTKKLESDESLRKAFEADPVKVLKDNNVELSEKDIEDISGGIIDGGAKKWYERFINSWHPIGKDALSPPKSPL